MQTIIQRPFALLFSITLLISLSSFANGDPLNKKIPANNNDSTKGFKTLLRSSNMGFVSTDNAHFELNPMAVPFVNDFLPRASAKYENMKTWGKPYFLLYEKTLNDYGIPVQLKYLSVIESDLQPNAISVKGAVGPWQLMDYEAKRLGLKVNNKVDERSDFNKSTIAAAKLLKELYNEFGDWLLVIAAYNGGAGCVKRAMNKAHSNNFWDLQFYLPEETSNHVKKYIATHYFFEGSGGWTTLTASETTEKKLLLTSRQNKLDSIIASANIVSMQIVGKYNAIAVSNYLSMNINDFNKLNPSFDKTLAAGNFYMLRLPLDEMEIFKAKRQYILQESVQLLLSGSVAINQ